MYTNEKMLESIKKVEANRAANTVMEPARMTAEEKENVLATYHPDYKQSEFVNLQIGPNIYIDHRRIPPFTDRTWPVT